MSQKTWDLYFLGMAQYASTKSKDPSTKCGAVVVRPDNTIAGTGYNGFPACIEDTDELYNNRELKYQLIEHCEMNAIGHTKEPVAGYTLYTHPFAPCAECVKHMLTFGIGRFVYPLATEEKLCRWGESFKKTLDILQRANRKGSFPFDEYTGAGEKRSQTLTYELQTCNYAVVHRQQMSLTPFAPAYMKQACKLQLGHVGDHILETYYGHYDVGSLMGDVIWTKEQ
jgi:dCMP deaminase